MNKYLVIEHWFHRFSGREIIEVAAFLDTEEEAKVYICQHKCKNNHKWYIYSRND